ncbi:Chlorophyll a-b binding protein 7, chloroplastic, partial [Cucurbita argyrosperma subsp. argyrosperma]
MASACASSAIAAVAISSSRQVFSIPPPSQKNGCLKVSNFLTGKRLRLRKYTAAAVAPRSAPSLRWNQQAELVHCRWAMLGAAGIFIPEFLTKIGILNTPSWYTAGELEYFTDTTTLFIVELIFIGWAEGRRWADILKPGCVNTDPIFPNNKLTGTDVGYPGGLWFDPLGWGSGSPEKIKELRTKEIKNGRLAMLAVMGAWFQHIYTGTGPIDNLFAHLADPGHATVFAVSF